MPAGNLALAAPIGVLPQSLCTSFVEARQYPMLENSYKDDTYERSLIVDGVNAAVSLRTWKLAKRLSGAKLIILRNFFELTQGGPNLQQPGPNSFYFYNPLEPVPGQAIGSNFDASGASVQGRHTVIFRGNWTERTSISRTDTSLQLAEIA